MLSPPPYVDVRMNRPPLRILLLPLSPITIIATTPTTNLTTITSTKNPVSYGRGGAFAEWDFLRGIKEGWMPPLPRDRSVASQDLYGTCLDIYNETNDDYDLIVDEYPDPRTLDWTQYQGWDATDDFVLSDPNVPEVSYHQHKARPWYVSNILLVSYIGIVLFLLRRRMKRMRELVGYEELK